MAETNKIDSNVTGLRIAAEETLGVLPASPVWYDLEPNSYNDFGGNLSLLARNPINPGRQRKKGVITDLDASGGFNQDLTFSNLSHMWEGLFLANKQEKFNKLSDGTGATSPIESIGVSDDMVVDVDVSALIYAGDLVWSEGWADAGNNGLLEVASVSTDTITFVQTLTATATAPSGASIRVVGHEFAVGDLDVTATAGSLPRLTSTAKDFTELGLIAGETIFIGGDTITSGGDMFTDVENNGFARISATPTANEMILDKTGGGTDGETEMSTVADTTQLVRIWFGDYVRNVSALSTAFNRETYHVERSLGIPRPTSAPLEIQSEVLKGAIVNEFAMNIAQGDKITTDWTFIGTDNVQLDGANPGAGGGDERLTSDNTGSIATIETATAYNTSSDFSRIKLSVLRPTQGGVAELAAPIPLFAYVTDLTLSLTNNATPNKAVGTLGAFDVTAGTVEVSGDITAYFADVAATQAVRNNSDVTLDIAMVKDFGTGVLSRKAGIHIDLPLIGLGDGRLTVSQDEAIQLPLTTDAAEYENFGHTMMLTEFTYLPDAADS